MDYSMKAQHQVDPRWRLGAEPIDAASIRDIVGVTSLICYGRRTPKLLMTAVNLEALDNPLFWLTKSACVNGIERAFGYFERAEQAH